MQPLRRDPGDVADVSALRDASRASAIDALRDRFGAAAVQRGLGFTPQEAERPARAKPDRTGREP